MSIYCFVACDKKLPAFSIGIEDQGYRIIIEDERHVLNIFEDVPNDHTKKFTDKPVIMSVETGLDFSTVATDMLSYIQKAMIDNDSVELWCTWIGTVSLGNRKTERKSVAADELTTGDLCWIVDDMNYSHPKCLKVYKWTKGKR